MGRWPPGADQRSGKSHRCPLYGGVSRAGELATLHRRTPDRCHRSPGGGCLCSRQGGHDSGRLLVLAQFTGKVNFGAFPPPVAREGDTCYFIDHTDMGIGINAASPNKEAALKLVEWMASADFAERFSNSVPGFSPSPTTSSSSRIRVASTMMGWRDTCDSTLRLGAQFLTRGALAHHRARGGIAIRGAGHHDAGSCCCAHTAGAGKLVSPKGGGKKSPSVRSGTSPPHGGGQRFHRGGDPFATPLTVACPPGKHCPMVSFIFPKAPSGRLFHQGLWPMRRSRRFVISPRGWMQCGFPVPANPDWGRCWPRYVPVRNPRQTRWKGRMKKARRPLLGRAVLT